MAYKYLFGASLLAYAFGAATPEATSAQDLQQIEIPSQSLGGAIKELGRQTGLQIAANRNVIAGLRSTAVSANLGPEEALGQILAGSGLTYRLTGPNSVVIERISQTDAGSEPLILDQIFVQGELQTRTLQETSTSVTVFRGSELEERGEVDAYDAIERAPNVAQSGGESDFVIRGIDGDGVGGAGTGRTISVQVDGVALPDSTAVVLAPFSTWDLEQVEVLRGPQSTQQGRNALAGAVIFRSRDPIYENEIRLRGGGGGHDSEGGGALFGEAAFAINRVLVEDHVALRLSGSVFNDAGFITNVTLDDQNAGERTDYTARAKLRVDPTDDLEIIGSFSYARSDQGTDLVDDPFFPDQRITFSDVREVEELTQYTAGLRIGYDVNDSVRIEAETSFYEDEAQFLSDFDRTAAPFGINLNPSDAQVFEQDLRVTVEGDWYSGTLGFFYTDIEADRGSVNRLPAFLLDENIPPGIFINTTGTTITETTNLAVFGEVELDADVVLPGLSFVLGARYDYEEVDTFSFSTITLDPPIPAPLPPDANDRRSSEFDAFLPKIGASYEWETGISTSFTYQEGYRAGGSIRNALTGEVSNFDPEFTRNFELAFRGEFLDGRLLTNANAFLTYWRDQQIIVPDSQFPGLITSVNNAGKSRLYGGEVSIEFAATEDIDLFANVGFVETEFTDFVTGTDDFTGNEFPGAPDVTLALGGAYRFAPGWTAGVDASFTAGAFDTSQNDPALRSDDRFLVNAQLTYEADNVTAGIYARNIFNNNYALNRFQGRGGAFGPTLVQAGDPVTVGAILQVEF